MQVSNSEKGIHLADELWQMNLSRYVRVSSSERSDNVNRF